MNRDQAIKSGESRYLGPVCVHHPALGGERYVRGHRCVECVRVRAMLKKRQGRDKKRGIDRPFSIYKADYMDSHAVMPTVVEVTSAPLTPYEEAVFHGSKTYKGDWCQYHPELDGLRRTDKRRCVQCVRESMREYARRSRERNRRMLDAARLLIQAGSPGLTLLALTSEESLNKIK